MMKILAICALGLTAAGCVTTGSTPMVKVTLPAIPVDMGSCLKQSGVNIPKRALTVADVETLWKTDRLRLVMSRNCGQRLAAWYGDLRAHWK